MTFIFENFWLTTGLVLLTLGLAEVSYRGLKKEFDSSWTLWVLLGLLGVFTLILVVPILCIVFFPQVLAFGGRLSFYLIRYLSWPQARIQLDLWAAEQVKKRFLTYLEAYYINPTSLLYENHRGTRGIRQVFFQVFAQQNLISTEEILNFLKKLPAYDLEILLSTETENNPQDLKLLRQLVNEFFLYENPADPMVDDIFQRYSTPNLGGVSYQLQRALEHKNFSIKLNHYLYQDFIRRRRV